MRVAVVALLLLPLAGCLDSGDSSDSLSADEIKLLVLEAMQDLERNQNPGPLALDGHLEFRLGDGPWSTVPPQITTHQSVAHPGDPATLRLDADPPAPLEVRYTGNTTNLTGSIDIWAATSYQRFDLDEIARFEWTVPAAAGIGFGVQDADGSWGYLGAEASWTATWTVTGTVASDADGGPVMHTVIPAAGDGALISVDVWATDESQVPGRKTALALDMGGYPRCSVPDDALLAESTDHFLAEGVYGPALRIQYGHRIPECWSSNTPSLESVDYEMDVTVDPFGGWRYY